MYYLYQATNSKEELIATSRNYDKLFQYQKNIELEPIDSGKTHLFVIKNSLLKTICYVRGYNLGEIKPDFVPEIDNYESKITYSCDEELMVIWPTEVNPNYKELSYCIEFPLCVWGTIEEINKVFGSELSEESDDYLGAYAYYNPLTKDVYLMGYTARYNGTNSEMVRVILTDDEKKAFVNIFEDICKENEGITCTEFMLKEAIEMLNLEFKEKKND